jgi:hypothetical protein
MKVGDILRSDFQSDPFEGRYQLIADLGGGKWEIEYLPADEHTEDLIIKWWAAAEAEGFSTTPIWDKTWNECDKDAGERPQIIGHRTYEDMLERDLAHYRENAGRRTTVTFISRKRWAEYF